MFWRRGKQDQDQLPTEMDTVAVEADGDDSEGMSLKWFAIIAIGGTYGLMLVFFLVGFLIAIFADPLPTADRFASIRDILFILVFFQVGLIVIAVTILVVQVARLVDTVRGEAAGVIDDVKATASTAKGTAQFVGRNVTTPIISVTAFFAGVLAFVREIGGIRSAIRRSNNRRQGQINGQDESQESLSDG